MTNPDSVEPQNTDANAPTDGDTSDGDPSNTPIDQLTGPLGDDDQDAVRALLASHGSPVVDPNGQQGTKFQS